MARNATVVLSGSTLDRAEFFAGIVSGYVGDESGSTIVFNYTDRVKGITSEREARVLEIVGTPGTSSHGFKGETDRGPRTFNFANMEGTLPA